MTDSYQAIYDGVRSRISNGDVGAAVREAVQNAFDISWSIARIEEQFVVAGMEMQRPSVLFKPILKQDGDTWTALLGPNLQEGLCGFGKSPAEAMSDFDTKWYHRCGDDKY